MRNLGQTIDLVTKAFICHWLQPGQQI